MSDGKREEPDVRKELNQLWRTTLDQFDEIKNAIVRSSSAGKAKLDATFLRRQRERLLIELGAQVMEAAEQGEVRLPERVQNIATRVRELEAQIEEQEGEVERLLRPEEEPFEDPADESPQDLATEELEGSEELARARAATRQGSASGSDTNRP
jgi:hypothetical protein